MSEAEKQKRSDAHQRRHRQQSQPAQPPQQQALPIRPIPLLEAKCLLFWLDYIDTHELFGTVPLHSAELGETLSKIIIVAAAKKSLRQT